MKALLISCFLFLAVGCAHNDRGIDELWARHNAQKARLLQVEKQLQDAYIVQDILKLHMNEVLHQCTNQKVGTEL